MNVHPEDLQDALWILRTANHVPAIAALEQALVARLSDPTAPGLDSALGLATPGPSYARQTAIKRRDHALRAYRTDHLSELSTSAAAALMAQAMSRYEASRWPRDRDADRVPTGELETIAHRALSDGVTLPSAGALRNILAG